MLLLRRNAGGLLELPLLLAHVLDLLRPALLLAHSALALLLRHPHQVFHEVGEVRVLVRPRTARLLGLALRLVRVRVGVRVRVRVRVRGRIRGRIRVRFS